MEARMERRTYKRVGGDHVADTSPRACMSRQDKARLEGILLDELWSSWEKDRDGVRRMVRERDGENK